MFSRSLCAPRKLAIRRSRIPITPYACRRHLGSVRSLLTTQQDPRPRSWNPKTLHALAGEERNLATAWGDYRPADDLQLDEISPMLGSVKPSASSGLPSYELQSFNYSSPLVIEQRRDEPISQQRINGDGIPGDLAEMKAIFHALVDVGKLDRAFLILERLKRMDVSRSDLVGLHNRYLQKRVAEIHADPGMDRAEDLHRWYELEIRQSNIPATSETIAYMLKASLLTSHGPRLTRLVRRYMEALPQHEGFQDFYTGDVLTDQDLAIIANLSTDHDFEMSSREPEDVQANEPIEANATEASADSTAEVPLARPSSIVEPTVQKGIGLKTLKKTLSLFSTVPDGHDIHKLSYKERRDIQVRLEKDCIQMAVDRWKEEQDISIKLGQQPVLASISRSTLGVRVSDWLESLEKRLEQELKLTEASEAAKKKNREDLERCMYGPFIRLAKSSRLAAVTIITMLNCFAIRGAERGVSVAFLVSQVAKMVELDIRTLEREQMDPTWKRRKKNVNLNIKVAIRRLKYHLGREQTQAAAEAQRASQESVTSETSTAKPATLGSVVPGEGEDTAWPVAISTKIGSFLVSALLETAKVTCLKEQPETGKHGKLTLPAFHHTFGFSRGKKIGVIRANRILVEIMKREPRNDFLARHLPMVVEPLPWTKFDKGGFLESSTNLVRTKLGADDQKIYTEAALERGHMDQVLKGLDVLGKTGWNINRPVFDVMLEVWNSGKGLANIPSLIPNITLPEHPNSSSERDPMVRIKNQRKMREAMNNIAGHHSVRCFINFQLEVARTYRHQTFYFPHNLDFRGRAYPIPPYLNHMGADHARGLLRFAVGKELGEKGLRWLKIHLANVFGYDKASLRDREAFAMQNLDNIADTVNNPLGGKRWWLEAEDPWQCLATCYELKAALDSPDPTKFVSHLPVHQDGTCNGLQHYAALGGDMWGARQVNLEPGDRPADVYTAVADLVKELIAKDREQGNLYAETVDGKISRKVVKTTVMTNVYGVTWEGAKKQVWKQFRIMYPDLENKSGIPFYTLAAYVATKIFMALAEMFGGANEIQRWLGETGSRICRSFSPTQIENLASLDKTVKAGRSKKAQAQKELLKIAESFQSTIIWTTPLRMPVVQPYRKNKSRIIQTCLQDIQLTVPDKFDPVNHRKQLQGFPPNFIHSLDASHMLLTALECNDRGLSFAAVHDSFWTNAADVDTMNDIIREAFIRIHQEDVMGRLCAEFEARYKNFFYLARVDASSEVAKKMKAHRATSKLTSKQELFMEKKRMDLLNSWNVDDVEEGKKMVTPATIFEADRAAAAALVEDEELDHVALVGEIPEDSHSAEPESDMIAHGGEDALDGGLDDADDVDEVEADAVKPLRCRGPRAPGLPNDFALAVTANKTQKLGSRNVVVVEFWAPFKMPPLPKKGDFDVTRLRDSKYFFS